MKTIIFVASVILSFVLGCTFGQKQSESGRVRELSMSLASYTGSALNKSEFNANHKLTAVQCQSLLNVWETFDRLYRDRSSNKTVPQPLTGSSEQRRRTELIAVFEGILRRESLDYMQFQWIRYVFAQCCENGTELERFFYRQAAGDAAIVVPMILGHDWRKPFTQEEKDFNEVLVRGLKEYLNSRRHVEISAEDWVTLQADLALVRIQKERGSGAK